jgi:hypothetical protein
MGHRPRRGRSPLISSQMNGHSVRPSGKIGGAGVPMYVRTDGQTYGCTDIRNEHPCDEMALPPSGPMPKKDPQKIVLTVLEIQCFCELFQLHPDFSQFRSGCN